MHPDGLSLLAPACFLGGPGQWRRVGGCPGRGRKQSEVTADGDGVVRATGPGPGADVALVVLTWG